MKLKTAIGITQTSYELLCGVAALCLFGSFFAFRNGYFIPIFIFSIVLFTVAYHLKIITINFYLKNGSYPYEFLIILKKFNLIDDVDISWNEELINGPKESYWQTDAFLKENNLDTSIKLSDSNRIFLKKDDNATNPFAVTIEFKSSGLYIKDWSWRWNEINDWEFLRVGKYEPEKIKFQIKIAMAI